jgi:hypothetical protein
MPLRMPPKGQVGSKMTPTSGSSLPIVGPYLRLICDGVSDGNERPGAEELDGDARVPFGGRGVPGAA